MIVLLVHHFFKRINQPQFFMIELLLGHLVMLLFYQLKNQIEDYRHQLFLSKSMINLIDLSFQDHL
jgi:hypothetical protein